MSKRVVLGSILKSKDASKPDYLKLRLDRKDDFKRLLEGADRDVILNLESKKTRLASIEKAVLAGTMTEDMAERIRETVEKMPDFVRFEVTTYSKE